MDQPWRFPHVPGNFHPAVRAQQFPFLEGNFHPNGFDRHLVEPPPFYRPVHGVPPFMERPPMPMPPPFLPPRQHVQSWNREQFHRPFPPDAHQFPNDPFYRQNFPKKMRVEEEISFRPALHHHPDFLPPRASFEDARRFNLIRDHERLRADPEMERIRPSLYDPYEDPVIDFERRDRFNSSTRASSSSGDHISHQYGSIGALDHGQQVHRAPNSESQRPSPPIYPNPSQPLLGRYSSPNNELRRKAEEHELRSDAFPPKQMHQFSMQHDTNSSPPRGSFPPQSMSQQHLLGSESIHTKRALKDKRIIVDVSRIFCKPHRSSRPERIAVILRGLPGSGKSYLAKALRDLEVANGGAAPRIHCIDDYFMSEVESVEDNDVPKTSGLVNGKKEVSEKFEYCYEPEMEEAHRASMLKAFKKTVDDQNFSFVIVDDRNLRVADFAQFWSIGKRSGYEVYLVEAPYKDPAGCAARNIHGFTLENIRTMAERWEEAPPFYLQLDIQMLFRVDDLHGSNIQEVEMDAEDVLHEERVELEMSDEKPVTINAPSEESLITGERWELQKSKWLKDLDEEDVEENKTLSSVLPLDSRSGLIKVYDKRKKSVQWGDQLEKRGFSIGAKPSTSSLTIGPGPGYNLETNPLVGDEVEGSTERNPLKRKSPFFLDHIRAERESFRAVFDRRRQRVGGFDDTDDDQQ